MRRGTYYRVTKRKRIKTGRLLFLLALCGFLVTILLSVRFIGVLKVIQDTSDFASSLPSPVEGKRENILLFSVLDKDTEPRVSDVVLVAYHPEKKDFRAIHVPVDTIIREEGPVTLAGIYEDGGKERLVGEISALFSVPVHFFIELDEGFLPKAVDKVNGITHPELSLESGIDALQAIYEEGLSMQDRLERRRAILTAITHKVVSGNWLQKTISFQRVSPLVKTNYSWRKLLATLDSLKSIDYRESATVLLLPGDRLINPDGDYWEIDANQLEALVTWLGDDLTSIPRSQITVEVLNGSGIAGVAGQVAEKLRSEGFNVIRYGNADRYDYEVSQVISRVEDVGGAKEVSVLIRGAQLRKSEIEDSDVMVTVIIGKNYIDQ